MKTLNLSPIREIGGRKRPSYKYYPVILETYHEYKPLKNSLIHARPITGQGKFLTTYDAECSRPMRKAHPVGTKFLVWAQIIDREGTPFVYTSWRWPVKVVDDEFIKNYTISD